MIRVENLSKRYGRVVAVSNVTFSAEPGTVTGFLGPNGAGKSTTLRMLTGLTPPTSGTATIAGRAYRDLPNPGRVVGVMLDASAQHSGRTGRETLRVAAGLLGVAPRRADELLEEVGLAGAAGRRVGGYSLGMRQRLGIAQALLGDPAVLLLDEPVNGLDPEGIRWTRTLLRDFASRGGTVVLSSHLLSEVEATVDRLVVIGHGRVVAEGTLAELQGAQGTVARSLDPGGRPAQGRHRTPSGPRRRAHGRRRRRDRLPARRGRWARPRRAAGRRRHTARAALLRPHFRQRRPGCLTAIASPPTTLHRQEHLP